MKVLLLAGTGEARQLAKEFAAKNIPAIATLSGATRAPLKLAIETVSGGFGGDEGFRRFLHTYTITHIIDATHPFAWNISDRALRISSELGLRCLHVRRPPWIRAEGDKWALIAQEDDAADHIPSGSRVFLATGRQTLNRFSALSKCHLICRQIDPPNAPFPFPNGEFLVGRPPFSVAAEEALFERLKIDWLVVKNAGGAASATKLTAARALGLPVAMIQRPPPPKGEIALSVEEALAWLSV